MISTLFSLVLQLGAVRAGTGLSKLACRDGPSCPADVPLSCSSPSVPSGVDACCFETPGGVVVLTQFWDADPPKGPEEEFTIHGLWPDNCDGTYEQYCNKTLEITGTVEDIVVGGFNDAALHDYMTGHWKGLNGDEDLWIHEWDKHGTCMSTILPECYAAGYTPWQNAYDYFRITVNLHKKLPTAQWLIDAGITPSDTKTYTKAAVQAALDARFGAKVYFKCGSDNAISEAWYFHHVKGSILGEQFVPIDRLLNSGCPETGIRFPSKAGGGSTPTSSSSGTSQPSPTPSSGDGTRTTIKAGSNPGCLISGGKYYESGTCASFTVAGSIRSSKGYCAVGGDNVLTCASGNAAAQFDVANGQIAANGVSDWCFGAASGSPPQTQVVLNQNGACNGKSTFKLTA